MRTKIPEFELATSKQDHNWLHFDLTETFGEWLRRNKCAEPYFPKPQLLSSILRGYGKYLEEICKDFLQEYYADDNTVLALSGIGALFGFIKVRELVDRIAPLVPGRLLVFFPGSYENNNFCLLNSYDGWNYHAFVITSDKE